MRFIISNSNNHIKFYVYSVTPDQALWPAGASVFMLILAKHPWRPETGIVREDKEFLT